MRLRVYIPQAMATVRKVPEVCPYSDCEGKHFKLHQKRCRKPVRDTQYSEVEAQRWRCLHCGRTHRVYPQGVDDSQHSERLRGLAILLYVLGLSYGGVEDVLVALAVPLGKSTVYRDVQAAGEQAQRLRQEWIEQHAGKMRVVGSDLTQVRCKGKDVVVGVAVDAQQGLVVDIVLLDDERTETLQHWLQPLLETFGVQVMITDDADGFKEVADQAGVDHQLCRRHVTCNALAFIAEAAEQVLKNQPAPPTQLGVSSEQLCSDLEALEWIILGLPGHGAALLEQMYLRYAHAPSPSKGEQASIWYRMRNHVLHLWNHWKRITCYRTSYYSHGLEVEATNNCTERAIGWGVKDRYRTMRGYKREQSIRNVTTLTAWLLEQPIGYDMSPLFAA
jgi:transposase-like protein